MFRIHATLSNHYKKTYLSAAPDCFTAVKALERLLSEQAYSFAIRKIERCEASES